MDKKVELNVEGMTCGNCALSVKKILEKKGATNVAVNFSSGEVIFTLEPEKKEEDYRAAIENLGYKIRPAEDNSEASQHNHNHSSWGNRVLPFCALLTIPLLMHMFVDWPLLHHPWFQAALATPVFIMGMLAFLPSAFRSIKNGIPNMDVLIVIGSVAAYFYSWIGLLFIKTNAHQYIFFETSASIITLVLFGNWLEHRSVKATTKSIRELSRLQPSKSRLVMQDSIGKETIMEVDTRFVKTGDILQLNDGDAVPVDGEIWSGQLLLNEQMLTGESLPLIKSKGETVIGGTIVVDGQGRIKATQVGQQSFLSRIIRLVQEAQGTKPNLQKLADKISAIFVPLVLSIAAVAFLINFFALHHPFSEAMMRSIAVLVISCPCAMGLATPAAIAVGLGRAARMGILVKGGDTLEQLKTIKQIVFDKTGTLTTGDLKIKKFATKMEEESFKSLVAELENYSSHPIAKSITKQWVNKKEIVFSDVKEIKGKGIEAKDEAGNIYQLGAYKWLKDFDKLEETADLFLLKNKQLIGSIWIEDELRPDAAFVITELKKRGYKTILMSGDKTSKAESIAQQLGIEDVYAECSPEAKHELIGQLTQTTPTAMVGDGINDAPALAKATLGISFGSATQVAIQSSQIILTGQDFSKLPQAIQLGIATERTIKQNLFWAFFYNVLAIPVAAAGLLTPTWGAGAMAMSDIVLIANSLHLNWKKLS